MLALALLCSLAGPPILPPLPGESAPAAPESEPTATEPAPSRPASPAPSKPATPVAKPEAPAEPTSQPAAPPPAEGTFSIPKTEEPPQPASTGPAPEPAAPPPDAKANPRPSEGPAAAPRIGEPSDAPPPAFLQLPPPSRPPYRGTGLFIGAGVAFAVALTEQIIAHRLVKNRCIDPIGRGDFDTGEDIGEAVTGCAPGVLPALALRVHSDIGLLAAISLTTAGAMTRGNADAYDDVFGAAPRRRQVAGLRIAGIGLVGAGVVSWLSTGAASWGVVGSCGTARCVNGGRLMAFITRDVSAAMVASGAGMLAFAETYRRRHDGYTRDRALSIGPAISRGQFGLRAGGRF
ncbi:MAG: hypothetical protein AAGA54_12460 [Myxococcota bacterium]